KWRVGHPRGCLSFLCRRRNAMSDRTPMTKVGYEKLKAELRQLETEEEPKLAARVAAARSEGDLSENAEYHGARESLQYLHARMSEIRSRLSHSYIVDTSKMPKDQ